MTVATGPRLSPIDVVLPRCAFCHAPFTALGDAWLEFFDGVTLRWPHDPATLIGVLAHTACGPDSGYNIALPRLLADGVTDEPRSWFHHLSTKPWFADGGAAALDVAYAFAQQMARGGRMAVVPRPVIARPSRRLALVDSEPRDEDDLSHDTYMELHRLAEAGEAEERRARRKARQISASTRARIMERDDFRCRRCGATSRDERLQVDHIVPVALGGSSDDANLQTLCETCNSGKAARPPHPHDMEPR